MNEMIRCIVAILLSLACIAPTRIAEAQPDMQAEWQLENQADAQQPEHLPTVTLKIGIVPFDAPKSGNAALDPGLKRYFEEVGAEFRARTSFNVEVVPAMGNYYQVLQWLRDGLIHGAIVSSFTAYLLDDDPDMAIVPVVEFSRRPRGSPENGPLVVTIASTMNGDREPAAESFRLCIRNVFASLDQSPVDQRCELRFVSHLSTTGFVVPMMAISSFAPTGSDAARAKFWARVMEWSRFEFWHDANVPEPKNIPVITFSYGRGAPGEEVLDLKPSIPNLNDVLVLGHRRKTREIAADREWAIREGRIDEYRRKALLEASGSGYAATLPDEVVPPSSATTSPWTIAGNEVFPWGSNLLGAGEGNAEASAYQSTTSWCESCRAALKKAMAQFHPSTTSDAELGRLFDLWYRQGQYAFTTNELIDLLHADQIIRKAPRAALVLPGGGVRATYQSVILDWLYGHRIYNGGPSVSLPENVSSNRLVINGIAGTSGGALLGYLAARRDDRKSDVLTRAWIDSHRKVRTSPLAIFPFWNVLRWFSIIVLLAVFAATAAIHLPTHRQQDAPQVPYWYTVVLTTGLMCAPFLIWRNTIRDPTFMTRWEAAAFLAVLVCVHFVHSISVGRRERTTAKRSAIVGGILIALGVAAVYALVLSNPMPRPPEKPDSTLSALAATGIDPAGYTWTSGGWSLAAAAASLLILAGLTIGTRKHTSVDRVRVRGYVEAMMLFMLLAAGTAALVLLGERLGHVTPLELTLDYWVWIAIAAIFTAKLLVITFAVFPSTPLKYGIRFLTRPSGSAPFPYTPMISMILWSGISLVVWMAFIAPSIYPSAIAREAFERSIPADAPARVPLVVSMTALRSRLPQFTNYRQGDYYAFSEPIDVPRGFGSERLFRMAPRSFSDAVFASASPFPIFPAVRVPVEAGRRPGLFLDGGYAHRIPIEGAKLLGAAQILVVENVARKEADPARAEGQLLGTLTTNLASAVGFLFERSQGIDVQVAKQAVVGTIYPDWKDPNPFLMDFRAAVVRRLHDEAVEDLQGHRVARVESWGEPARSW